VINQLKDEYSIRFLCETLDVHRGALYHQPRLPKDQPVRDALQGLAGQWPTYGYRRLTIMLHRQGHPVNAKRVRRLMHEMSLSGEAPARRLRTTDSDHSFPRYPNLVEGLEVVRPDQVWVADITYLRLKKEFVYLAVLMDVFTRCIRGWHLGRTLEQELTITALDRALAVGRPEVHHSDQGVQYAATAYVELLNGAGAQISMASVGEPKEN
jgi:putative transposase